VTVWLPPRTVTCRKQKLPKRTVTTPLGAASTAPCGQGDFSNGAFHKRDNQKGHSWCPPGPARAGGRREAPAALLLWLGGFAHRASIARPRAKKGPCQSAPTKTVSSHASPPPVSRFFSSDRAHCVCRLGPPVVDTSDAADPNRTVGQSAAVCGSEIFVGAPPPLGGHRPSTHVHTR